LGERDGRIYFRGRRERCGLVETAPVKDGWLAGERTCTPWRGSEISFLLQPIFRSKRKEMKKKAA